jgi:hypothetical protein
MENLLHFVKSAFKVNKVCITNTVFKMHFKWTIAFLLFAAFLVSSKQFFGDPIICNSRSQSVLPNHYLDAHCWVASTPVESSKDSLVSQSIRGRFQRYYTFVWLTLLLQCGLFYWPFYIWKQIEAGLIKVLVMTTYNPILDLEEKESKMKALVNYFTTLSRKRNHLALKFTLCEFLNLLNVVFQMFAVNWFLG